MASCLSINGKMPALIKVIRRAGKRTGPFDLKDFVEAGGLTANDLKLPDGPLVKAAYEHAEEISDPWLFNHVVRSWLFAAALAHVQQLTVSTMLNSLLHRRYFTISA